MKGGSRSNPFGRHAYDSRADHLVAVSPQLFGAIVSGRRRLLDGHWVGRRKRILESVVQRLLLAPPALEFVRIDVALTRFVLRVGNHIAFSDRAAENVRSGRWKRTWPFIYSNKL